MLGALKRRISTIYIHRARHILYGQQNLWKPPSSNKPEVEEIQRKIIELEKITHRSVVSGREILWSNTSDYMKANKANEQFWKVLTTCAVILGIHVCLFIQAGRDLKRRRRDDMNEREIQRNEMHLAGEERNKIGRAFVVQ